MAPVKEFQIKIPTLLECLHQLAMVQFDRATQISTFGKIPSIQITMSIGSMQHLAADFSFKFAEEKYEKICKKKDIQTRARAGK